MMRYCVFISSVSILVFNFLWRVLVSKSVNIQFLCQYRSHYSDTILIQNTLDKQFAVVLFKKQKNFFFFFLGKAEKKTIDFELQVKSELGLPGIYRRILGHPLENLQKEAKAPLLRQFHGPWADKSPSDQKLLSYLILPVFFAGSRAQTQSEQMWSFLDQKTIPGASPLLPVLSTTVQCYRLLKKLLY